MPKILFIAEVPPNDVEFSTNAQYSSAWRNFLKEAESKTKPSKSVSKLLEGSWLIDADGAWPWLAAYTSAADTYQIPFKILLIDDLHEITSSKPAPMKVSQDAVSELNRLGSKGR